ncbi:thioredoxin family protein [Bisgaard Taxon 45]
MKKYLTCLATLFVSVQAFALDFKPFEQQAFDTALQSNQPVLIDVYADWCPTCKRQVKVLEPILKEAQFKDYTVFKVDYDEQKDALTHFKVNRQSTLILFNQGKEVRRSIAETSEDGLRRFITLP